MEPGTLYLRVVLGAKPFLSHDLDSLAERMDVSRLMSKNPDERYFVTETKVAAMSMGNKLLFGARYYETLNESQRLAVAAHEFGHVLGGDSANRRRRIVLPAALVSFVCSGGVFVAMRSIPLLELMLALVFALSAAAFSSFYSRSYQREEMISDDLAASFVDGESLAGAIEAADSLVARGRKIRVGVRRHASTEKRLKAIRGRPSL